MVSRLALLVLLLVGIVLLPLRAVAETVPMLFAYDAAVSPTATTVVGGCEAVRSEAERPAFNDYDCAHVEYDDHPNPHVVAGAVLPKIPTGRSFPEMRR